MNAPRTGTGHRRQQDAPRMLGRTTSRPGSGRAHAPFFAPLRERPRHDILSAFFGIAEGSQTPKTRTPKTHLRLAPSVYPFAGMSDPVTQGVLHEVRHMKKDRQTTAAKAATNTNGGARALPVEEKIVTSMNVALCGAAFRLVEPARGRKEVAA